MSNLQPRRKREHQTEARNRTERESPEGFQNHWGALPTVEQFEVKPSGKSLEIGESLERRMMELERRNKYLRTVVQQVSEKTRQAGKRHRDTVGDQSREQAELKNVYRKINMQEYEIKQCQQRQEIDIVGTLARLERECLEKQNLREKLKIELIRQGRESEGRERNLKGKKEVNLIVSHEQIKYLKAKIKEAEEKQTAQRDLALKKHARIKELERILVEENYPQSKLDRIKFNCIHGEKKETVREYNVGVPSQDYFQAMGDIRLMLKVVRRDEDQLEKINIEIEKMTEERSNQMKRIQELETQTERLQKLVMRPKKVEGGRENFRRVRHLGIKTESTSIGQSTTEKEATPKSLKK